MKKPKNVVPPNSPTSSEAELQMAGPGGASITPEMAMGRFSNVVAMVKLEGAVLLDFHMQVGASSIVVARVTLPTKVAEQLRDVFVRNLPVSEPQDGLFGVATPVMVKVGRAARKKK